MNFSPYKDKIVIKPLTSDGIFMSNDRFEEVGEIISMGNDVMNDGWFKIGDKVSFAQHGCWKAKDEKGNEVYVVTIAPQFILGKFI